MRRKMILAEIHDQNREFVRKLLPQSSEVTLRFNQPSVARLVVADAHPVVAEVLPDGMRAVVWMVTLDGSSMSKVRLLEGAIGDLSGDGPFGTVTIPVTDDFADLQTITGWPNPTASLAAQTDDFSRYSGPSESRALAAISENATRLGLPWDIATSAGRGTTGDLELRFDKLSEQLVDDLTADRLQLTIQRDATTDRWAVAVTEGDTYPRPLTPQSGILGSWQWVRQRPTLTRVIELGSGTGTDREFAQVIDTTLETALNTVMEGVDNSSSAEAGADLSPYGLAALKDASGRAGISAVLRENSWFTFPDAYTVGTRVNVQIGPVVVEDAITEVDITHSAKDGFTVVPMVGLASADPTVKLVNFVTRAASAVRSLERR